MRIIIEGHPQQPEYVIEDVEQFLMVIDNGDHIALCSACDPHLVGYASALVQSEFTRLEHTSRREVVNDLSIRGLGGVC